MSLKSSQRQVDGVTILDLSGRITLGGYYASLTAQHTRWQK